MRGLSIRPWIVLSTAGILLLTLAAPASAATTANTNAETNADTTAAATVSVPATQSWTSTGIALPAGDVSFSASGTINVAGGNPDGDNTPDGDGPANPSCIAGPSEYSGSWTAAGLPCWSLIGRIGNGTPFFVGDSNHINVTTPGQLSLGVNDETGYFGDNSGSWTVHVTWQAAPPAPCHAAQHQTTVTQHAGFPEIPKLFTDAITLSWCGGPGGNQPRILSSHQSAKVEESRYSDLSGILLKLYEVAGVTFGVTPATAPTPSIDNGANSAATTASGLAFYQSINVGHLILLLIPSSLLAKAGLKFLPFLRTGQIGRFRTQLRAALQALWSGAVKRLGSGLSQGFGLPKWVAKLLADFGLGKLVTAAKDRDEKFVEQAILSLAALGSHPTLASVVGALQAAIKTATTALTSRTELWGPKITVTVDSGQLSGEYRRSYIDPLLDVSALHQTTAPAS